MNLITILNFRSALGIDRNVHEDTVQKSIGVSQTFKPITDFSDYYDKVLIMANELYERLNESQLVARTIILEFKTIKYDNKQRSTTFQSYIFEKKDILRASLELLKILWPISEPCRLLGIRFMHLRSRNSSVRDPHNKSDVIDLSDDNPGLSWPKGFEPYSQEAIAARARVSGEKASV